MVGLAAYAFAGGLQGAGTGLAEAATSRREAALRALERAEDRSWNEKDALRDRAWREEDRDLEMSMRARERAEDRNFTLSRDATSRSHQLEDRAWDARHEEDANALFAEIFAEDGTPRGRGAAGYDRGGITTSLARTESGGNYRAANKEGYVGQLQFGDDRLKDFMNATGQNFSKEQFRLDDKLQDRVRDWHVEDVETYIQDKGLDKMIGQDVGGIPMTRGSMIAMAHLGGKGGMEKFVLSGGKRDPADSNGTRLSDYAYQHSDLMRDPWTRKLLQAYTHPGLDAGQRDAIRELIEEATSGAEGFRVATPEEAAQYGAAGGQIDQSTNRFYPVNPPRADSAKPKAVDPDEMADILSNELAGVSVPPDVMAWAENEMMRLVRGGDDPFKAAAQVRTELHIEDEVENAAGTSLSRNAFSLTGGRIGTDPNGPPDEVRKVARGLKDAETPPPPDRQTEGDHPPAPRDRSQRKVGTIYVGPDGTLAKWTAQGKWEVIGG